MNVPKSDMSRRSFLKAAAALGVVAGVRPLEQALAQMVAPASGQDAAWMDGGRLRHRRDGMAKVTGQKLFAIDLRARDMQGWPEKQSYALLIMVPRADRIYEGLDLSVLGKDFAPDVLVDAERAEADGVHMPEPGFYGSYFLPKGQVSPMLGQPVAMGIWHDYERYGEAVRLLRFNDGIFQWGAAATPPKRKPYVAARYVRMGAERHDEPDLHAPLINGIVRPPLTGPEVQWPGVDDPKHGKAMQYSAQIQQLLRQPPEGTQVFSRNYHSQSMEPAALEPENGLAWYEESRGVMHMVGATQAPYATAGHVVAMVKASRFALREMDYLSAFTVGYGQKEHHSFPFYVGLAALYAQGRPVRLALDRWQHFQFALKRHPFDLKTTIAVDAEGQFQAFSVDMRGDGGGTMNFSPSVGTLGVASSQSVYYFPKSDLSVAVFPSSEVTAGSVRGYGTLQSMAPTEMLVDEIAERIGMDAIALRQKNLLRTGMRNTQGAVPAGQLRIGEILALAAKDPVWVRRAQRKAEYEAAHPGMRYGVGFASVQKSFGTAGEAALALIELSPEGRLKMKHITAEIGTGTTTAQMLAAEPFLGRPVDEVEFAAQKWPEMPVHTQEQPNSTPQADEDRQSQDPYWVPSFTSPQSASNSAYYFTHTTRQAAKLLLAHGLWPAALSIWGQPFGGPLQGMPVSLDEAEWKDGKLVAGAMEPLTLERLAARAHELGLVTGVCVHTFNRRSWASAEFELGGKRFAAEIDALSVRFGDGADAAKKAAMDSAGYAFQPRVKVSYPPVHRLAAGAVYYAPCATLVELAVSTGTGKVSLLGHKTWLECGSQLVPELVSGQLQGGVAMGIGHALYEELPLGPSGPGNGSWNFNRYHLPRASELAVWTAEGHVLPPVSRTDPPKGMAEVVMIPVVAACANAVAHATGKRFYQLPLSAERIKKAL
ncbi:molybdopterin cofactor-binding domain-containing protein [Comamonas sp.]|uniref:xanthine dehydrogenase family protein molybdopterin-binding subunit n=1 Tax=Comamonas sp. TaxID=34028 RepID=UPI0012CC8A04|nr:molybdopterin cofactor-binding domain-containing protein [Comamonas sp.]MPS94497.1 twin-arginine translocation signal domain-containing protein [Comamonas sp.]